MGDMTSAERSHSVAPIVLSHDMNGNADRYIALINVPSQVT